MRGILWFPAGLLLLSAGVHGPLVLPRDYGLLPDTGRVVGTVRVEGPLPRTRVLRIGGEPKAAVLYPNGMKSEALVVDGKKRLKWAFVYVKDAPVSTRFSSGRSSPLEFKRFRLQPRVLGMRAGRELILRNTDQVLHSAHLLTVANPPCNVGLPRTEYRWTARKPEVMVRVKCDVHPWEIAWVGVLDHPYFAVTDEHGRFEIPALPSGRYTVEVWHERFKPVTAVVDVGKDESVPLELVLKDRK